MRGEHLPGQKRTTEQREHDRDEIAAWLIQGQSIREITDGLNAVRPYRLSRQQVAKDTDAVREDFRAAVARRRDDLLAESCAKLARLEQQGWRAWNDSTKANRSDPRFLRVILDAIAMRVKLVGLGYPDPDCETPGPEEVQIRAIVNLPDDGSGVTG